MSGERIVDIIKKTSHKTQDIPIENKLSLYMLTRIKSKKAKKAILDLSKETHATMSFMGHVFLALKGSEKALKEIQSKITLMPDRLKIEGIKVLVKRNERNSVPLIKEITSKGDKKIKVYGIWALAKLGVIDLKKKAEKLIKKIKPNDEKKANLNLKGSLKQAIDIIEKTKPAY